MDVTVRHATHAHIASEHRLLTAVVRNLAAAEIDDGPDIEDDHEHDPCDRPARQLAGDVLEGGRRVVCHTERMHAGKRFSQ